MTDPSPTDRAIDSTPTDEPTDDADIPSDAVEEAERLTRLARNANESEAVDLYRRRRAELVSDHDYTPRVREEDDTLVLYPSEWMADGTVQLDRIEDTDRAVEVSLSGPGDADQFDEVDAANAAIVDRIAAEHGPEHAANVRAFADFMSNHYVRRVTEATAAEREKFRTEYYPRNVWPSDEQRDRLDRSLSLLDALDVDAIDPKP
ncbi:hypothetical protein SAMN05192561_101430 [Halopenitus malekzadehii]|uniref:RnhA operon protein n=1 Tax=Halopenitus malekzadehii TaxID=1267564 RepID=A0A1H6HTG4_9EURY|nr:rnhA operon protein [Halopenitus malekzadehii]SEH38862.1 hypothetical protein SAMN05192561_101430 [Halopenitus malekzadehii]